MLRVVEVIGNVRLCKLRKPQQVTVLICAGNDIEKVHFSCVSCLNSVKPSMTDIARRWVGRMQQAEGLSSGNDGSRSAVCPRVGAEVMVKRAVLLDDEDNVLDGADVTRMARLRIPCWQGSVPRILPRR